MLRRASTPAFFYQIGDAVFGCGIKEGHEILSVSAAFNIALLSFPLEVIGRRTRNM